MTVKSAARTKYMPKSFIEATFAANTDIPGNVAI